MINPCMINHIKVIHKHLQLNYIVKYMQVLNENMKSLVSLLINNKL